MNEEGDETQMSEDNENRQYDRDRRTEMLIEAVRAEIVLWDKRSPSFSVRRTEKDRAWERVASQIGITAEDAKQLWTRTKNYFQNRFRILGPSGSAAPDYDKMGAYGHQLAFLTPILKRGKSVSSAQFRSPVQRPPPTTSQPLPPQAPASPDLLVSDLVEIVEDDSIYFENMEHLRAHINQHDPQYTSPPGPATESDTTSPTPSTSPTIPQDETHRNTPPSPHHTQHSTNTATQQHRRNTPPSPHHTQHSTRRNSAPPPQYDTRDTSPQATSRATPNTSRRRKASDPLGDQILQEMREMRAESAPDANTAFGMYIAAELRQLDPETARRQRRKILLALNDV